MPPLNRLLLIGLFCTHALLARAVADQPVDFTNDLIPVFTKHGCNAGACHGAAIGRGGFKLSLYGGDPAADYDAIVRQVEGRRVNLSQPKDSLIVLKPTEYLAHGGGSVFELESASARLLTRWIQQGVGARSPRTLTRVEISPRQQLAEAVGGAIQLKSTAYYSDGTIRDVTPWTIFQAEDSTAVEIDSDLATCRVLRRGRHIVVARYLNEVVPIELLVPLADSNIDLSGEPRYNLIDEAVLKKLTALRIPVSPLVDDATFQRRVALDLTGRLPSSLGRHFRLADRPDRGALIDELLQSDEFTEYWTLQLAKWLRIRPQRDNGEGAATYHHWLADQIGDDISYKQLARTLIMATGDTRTNGPANFYRTVAGAREQAEFVSELFMGSRLRCANCHNHPLDRWTQDDYHGLAAIFAGIEGGVVVQEKPRGEVIHPRTLEAARAKIPGERFLDELHQAGAMDERAQLADWLTDSANPYFAKALVNRLWKQMMGRGLVDPVDDFRATNPATHPELLEALAEDFRASGHSLRHILGVIARSAAYARSSNSIEGNQDDDRFYSHALRRPLEAEVLADAISDVLGAFEAYGDEPRGTRAVALIDPKTPSRTLDVLGRCGRDDSCESTSGAVGGLSQKLHLFNGPLLNARIVAAGGRLQRSLTEGKQPIQIVSQFYQVALNRGPTDTERTFWMRELKGLSSTADKEAFLEDFVWGLLTCDEFVTNH